MRNCCPFCCTVVVWILAGKVVPSCLRQFASRSAKPTLSASSHLPATASRSAGANTSNSDTLFQRVLCQSMQLAESPVGKADCTCPPVTQSNPYGDIFEYAHPPTQFLR